MNKNHGFTLIEMLVVVAILGIIVMVGLPAFNNYYQTFKVRSAASQIVNDLRLVRQTATTQNVPYKLSIHAPNGGAHTYDVQRFTMAPGAVPTDTQIKTAANWVDLDPPMQRSLTEYVQFVVPNDAHYIQDLDGDGSGKRDIIFMPDGTVFNDGGTIAFNEDASTLANNYPYLLIRSLSNRIAKNRYHIYVTYVGKVTAIGYK